MRLLQQSDRACVNCGMSGPVGPWLDFDKDVIVGGVVWPLRFCASCSSLAAKALGCKPESEVANIVAHANELVRQAQEKAERLEENAESVRDRDGEIVRLRDELTTARALAESHEASANQLGAELQQLKEQTNGTTPDEFKDVLAKWLPAETNTKTTKPRRTGAK